MDDSRFKIIVDTIKFVLVFYGSVAGIFLTFKHVAREIYTGKRERFEKLTKQVEKLIDEGDELKMKVSRMPEIEEDVNTIQKDLKGLYTMLLEWFKQGSRNRRSS